MTFNPRIAAAVAVTVLGLAGSIAATYETSPGTNPGVSYLDRLPKRATPTACEGHTGKDVVVGKTYTQAQCDKWFQEDLVKANAVVHSCISRAMPINVEAALTDFAFNIGPGRAGAKDGLCILRNGKQPQIRALANEGNWPAVCSQFKYWTSAGGVQLAGLVKRRKDEQVMCEAAQ